MATHKTRRDIEIYEKYWKFTAAFTDIFGIKFNNCLNVIVRFIDTNKDTITECLKHSNKDKWKDLYKKLQEDIVNIAGFKGDIENAKVSARKVTNLYVKIGFIEPYLVGYHPMCKDFIKETSDEKKKIIFSKIFYENSSLASGVTSDARNLKHINFLLKTLDKNQKLSLKDITALMVTDITKIKKGYLTREELDNQYKYAKVIDFEDRKYNQISHLKSYLTKFVDLKYDSNNEEFWFADDPTIADKDFDESFARDGVKHRIYKDELKQESISIYGKPVCYCEKKAYRSLIASHIKPCIDCLREHNEFEAYDVNNGLLLSPTIDSYFDKKDISFNDDGTILIAKNVESDVKKDLESYRLDAVILNIERKKYLAYHRALYFKKNGE